MMKLGEGRLAELWAFPPAQDAPPVGHVPRLKGDLADTQKPPHRRRMDCSLRLREQMRRCGTHIVDGLGRGRLGMWQGTRGQEQIERQYCEERGVKSEERGARLFLSLSMSPILRDPACNPLRPDACQRRHTQRVEHHPAGRRAEQIEAGDQMIEEERERVPASHSQEQPQDGEEESAQHGERPMTSSPRPAASQWPQPIGRCDQGQQQPQRAHLGDKLGVAERGKNDAQIAQAVGRQQRPMEQQWPQAEAGHIHIAETAAAQPQLAEFQGGQQLGRGDQHAQQDTQGIEEEGGDEVAETIRQRTPACRQQPCADSEKIDIGRLCVTGEQSEGHEQGEGQKKGRILPEERDVFSLFAPPHSLTA